MKLHPPELRDSVPSGRHSAAILNAAAVIAGALLLSWPAIFNRFPLLYADSMTYLADGAPVARAIFLHQFSDYYGMRSLIYSLGILPFHWNISPWPIVALLSLLVAWVVWLVVRALSRRHATVRYLALILALSLLTGIGWYASFVMPDVLGPLLYLAFFLLFFARETLSRAERIGLYAIAWWAIASHASHLLLAAALCGLLALCAAFDRRPILRRTLALAEPMAVLALAAASQMALYWYLDGKPSLNGQRPPYLTARVIADGPGRQFLRTHCDRMQWAACGHLDGLSSDPDSFLWGPDAPYENASEDEKRRFEAEDAPFFLATVRAYPREQFEKSAANFGRQLLAFGIYGFDASDWIGEQFKQVIPASKPSYLQSRQAANELPLDLASDVQTWTVIASLAILSTLIPLLWRSRPIRLAALGLVSVSMVVLNAAVTGVLSTVDDRYQCRVVWLIPLLAGVSFFAWLDARAARRKPLSGHPSQEVLAASPGFTRSRSSFEGLK